MGLYDLLVKSQYISPEMWLGCAPFRRSECCRRNNWKLTAGEALEKKWSAVKISWMDSPASPQLLWVGPEGGSPEPQLEHTYYWQEPHKTFLQKYRNIPLNQSCSEVLLKKRQTDKTKRYFFLCSSFAERSPNVRLLWEAVSITCQWCKTNNHTGVPVISWY